MLTGPEIIKRVAGGDITIRPFVEENVNPNSVDLTLHNELLVYRTNPTVYLANADRFENFYEAHAARTQDQRELSEPLECAEWNDVLDMKRNNAYRIINIPDEGVVLIPGRLYLGSTVEYTETDKLVPGIEGRSSVGRLGIDVHATAGFGDVGFKGAWTLEISVTEPVRVYAGIRICQIYYQEVVGKIQHYESEKYQGQLGPRTSRLWKDFQTKEK